MTEQPTEEDIRESVEKFLRREMPQIQMHGGKSAVTDVDVEKRAVTIRLGGACSGCGISPMTIQAIKQRMPQKLDEVERVHAETGLEESGGFGAGASGTMPAETPDEDETPDAPF